MLAGLAGAGRGREIASATRPAVSLTLPEEHFQLGASKPNRSSAAAPQTVIPTHSMKMHDN